MEVPPRHPPLKCERFCFQHFATRGETHMVAGDPHTLSSVAIIIKVEELLSFFSLAAACRCNCKICNNKARRTNSLLWWWISEASALAIVDFINRGGFPMVAKKSFPCQQFTEELKLPPQVSGCRFNRLSLRRMVHLHFLVKHTN